MASASALHIKIKLIRNPLPAAVLARGLCVGSDLGDQLSVQRFFCAISRLGDGVFWYLMIMSLPLLMGSAGAWSAFHIAATGLITTVLYSALKAVMVRERPCISYPDITAFTAPLDRYSFPSGHTMNAVGFAVMFSAAVPALMWIVWPFTLLVAASRVILGMHYPSDVIMGAILGALVALGSLALFPV